MGDTMDGFKQKKIIDSNLILKYVQINDLELITHGMLIKIKISI